MLCEICSENLASYVISTIVNSSLKEFHACEDCATGNIESKIHITEKTEQTCPRCHCGYYPENDSNYVPLLGCSECYEHFHDQLTPLLRRIHGNISHKGKLVSDRQHDPKNISIERSFSHSTVSIQEAEWMQGSGPDFDVVVSSRIRLARNINGFMFCNVADQIELMEIATTVEKAAAEIAEYDQSPLHNAYVIDLEEIDNIDCAFLMERHLISRDLAEKYIARKVIIDEKEVISIMINEEDHIRLQTIGSGLQIRRLWEVIDAIDSNLGRKVNYSFSPKLGFLTACPTNIGTGLRVSVMFHLPALAITKEGKRLLASITNMGYAIRGMYGEGSRTTGAFYQISNDTTLGQSEEEIIERMQLVAFQILSREREERKILLGQDRIKLEDMVLRSYGTLINARTISSLESLELLSWISLGISLGIITGINPTDVARLLVLTRPAHLQKIESKKLDSTVRDINRAKVIRQILKNGGNN
jgi:protein arginine kinase